MWPYPAPKALGGAVDTSKTWFPSSSSGFTASLETWLVLGCASDPVTPISWKGQGSAVTKTFFHPALFHQDLRSLTVSEDSSLTPRTLFLKSHTQKLKTSPCLCADGSCGALVGMACEKKVASHWRPVCPDPWTEMGKAGGLPLPPPAAALQWQLRQWHPSVHCMCWVWEESCFFQALSLSFLVTQFQ